MDQGLSRHIAAFDVFGMGFVDWYKGMVVGVRGTFRVWRLLFGG